LRLAAAAGLIARWTIAEKFWIIYGIGLRSHLSACPERLRGATPFCVANSVTENAGGLFRRTIAFGPDVA
jgi:hypothetical protein